MNHDEQLAMLLDAWQESQARGEAVTPEALCRDYPHLLPDLSQRIAVLRRFDALLADEDGRTGEFPSTECGSSHDALPRGRLMPRAEGLSSLPVIGEEFGGYHIVALLGEGGMGRVYRATDPVLRREVALKVMKPEAAEKPEARERFLREGRAMAAVEHDHVVTVHQVGEVDGVAFLAMPLLKGETLAARLAREKVLPTAEVLRIGREAAAGLAAAHAQGLIHRDVKPANIWLETIPGEPGTSIPGVRVKLLDFGLVRERSEGDAVTQVGMVLGTPVYMSPEQALGQPLDHRSDLFSLGSVLYECCTGRRPFQGETVLGALFGVARRQPSAAHEANPSVPVSLSALIGRLLSKSPEDRPASAQVVAESLRAIESGTESSGGRYTGGLPEPVALPRRRMPWRWLTAAVVLALLGFFGCLALRPAVPPLTAKLDVGIWKKEDSSRGLNLGTAGALPLRAGDWMRIEAETNRPAYLYAIYLDAQGEASPLFPWRKYDWDNRAAEQKQSELHLPEDPLEGAPLVAGPSGIEAVLLLARDEVLSAEEIGRLRRLFAKKPPPAKFDPLRGAVWLGTEERFGNQRDRGRPNFDQSGTLLDPVERMRRLVRGELKELADDVRGVCYPFEGR
jgi:serine/threonine protein kinase